MTDILNRFGVAKAKQSPDQPFKRLHRDGDFWEYRNVDDVPPDMISGLTSSSLRTRKVEGGFNERTVTLLLAQPSSILDLALLLLVLHFPESLHSEICSSVNLPYPLKGIFDHKDVEIQKREASFRESVLNAYDRKCAFCKSATFLQNSVVDIEAAHIKWHSVGGPSVVSNGLALCVSHHKLFDRGALGLKQLSDSYRIVFAPALSSFGPTDEINKRIRGSSVDVPFDKLKRPSPEFVEWHWDQVFQGP